MNLSPEEKARFAAERKKFFEKYPDCPVSDRIACMNLIMKKTFAEQIVRGEKTVEFRSYSKHYCDRLYDYKVLDWGENNVAPEDAEMFAGAAHPIRIVDKIHFHPYNNSWWLDVEVIDNYIVAPSREDAEWLTQEYGDKEMAEMVRDFERQKLRERPLFFYFALGKILDTNLK